MKKGISESLANILDFTWIRHELKLFISFVLAIRYIAEVFQKKKPGNQAQPRSSLYSSMKSNLAFVTNPPSSNEYSRRVARIFCGGGGVRTSITGTK